MNTNTIIQVFVAIVVFALIFVFLIPLLPAPFGTIATILMVVIAIIWLLRLAGI